MDLSERARAQFRETAKSIEGILEFFGQGGRLGLGSHDATDEWTTRLKKQLTDIQTLLAEDAPHA